MVTVGVVQWDAVFNMTAFDAGVAKAETALKGLERSAGSLNLDMGGAAATKSIGDLETTLTRFDTTVKANGDTVSKYREEMSATAQATALLKQAQADAASALALYRTNMADVAETQVLLKETQVELTEQTLLLRAAQTAGVEASTALKVAQSQTAEATTALRVAQTGTADATTALRVASTAAADSLTVLRTAQVATEQATTALRDSQTTAADALAQQRVAAASASDALVILRTAQTSTAAAATDLKVASAAAADALAAQRIAATADATALNDARIATEDLRAKKLELQIQADATAASLKKSSASAADFKKGLEDMAGATAKAAEALGLLVVAEAAVDAVSVKMAADWQSKTNQIQNNTTMTTADVQVMDTAIRAMAATSPAKMNDLADGFAHIFNFGNSAADSVKILNVAMMSAVATGTSVSDTANTLASVMHEFKIKVDDASTAMNVLHLAAAEGNQTLTTFVENSSAALSIGANLGLSLNQVTAGFVALSRSGLDASRVNTQMIGIMTHIINPTAAARTEIERLSKATGIDLVSDFTVAGLQSRGFSGVMFDLEKAIAGNSDEILRLIPALRGGTGALALTGSAAGDLDTAVQSFTDTISGKTNPTLDAFQRTQETLAAKVGVFRNTIQLLAIELGTVLLPILSHVIDGLTALGDRLGVKFNVQGITDAKKAMDDLSAAQAKVDGTATSLGGRTSTSNPATTQDTVAAQQQLTDALTNATQAAALLDAALGFPHGRQGINATIANLGTLEDTAKTQAAQALDDVNAALDLPNGSLGPKAAADAVAQIKLSADSANEVVTALNVQLADAQANIQGVRDQMTTIQDNTKAANLPLQNQIDTINRLTPEEMQRRVAELQNKAAQATGALNKPDVSKYTQAALDAQTTKDNLAPVDTSQYTDAIKKIQDDMAGLDPEAATSGITSQIQSLQDEISGLNTDEFDRKINAIKDKLAEPAPNTQGITNQLTLLQGQLAGKQISQGQFNSQFGALSAQKAGIEQNYTDQTNGLQGQLAVLERERADQALANQETAKADKARITDLTRQATQIKENITDQRAADAARIVAIQRRQALDEKGHQTEVDNLDKTIKLNNDKAKAILAPWQANQDALARAADGYKALDDAAQAYRDLKVLPLKDAIDTNNQAEAAALAPLQAKLDGYTQAEQSIQRQKTYWDGVKTSVEGAKTALDNYLKTPFVSGDGTGAPWQPTAAQKRLYDVNTNLPDGTMPPDSPTAAQKRLMDVNTNLPGDTSLTDGILAFTDKLMAFGNWVIDHPDTIKNWLIGIGVALATLMIVLDPAAALVVGLTAVVGFFMYDYETNSTFRKFVDDVRTSFEKTTDAINTTIQAIQKFINIKTPSGDAKNDPIGGAASAVAGPGTGQRLYNSLGPAGIASDIGGGFNALGELGNYIRTHIGTVPDATAQQVGAADLGGQMPEIDSFVQHIEDVMGPGSSTDQAIQAFKDQITTAVGNGGDAAQAVKDAEAYFTDTFGAAGTSQAAIQQFGTYAEGVFGKGGQIDQYIGNDGQVSQTLRDMEQAFQANFDDQGNLRDPVNGWATFMHTVLGSGGTIAGFIGTNSDMSVTIGQLQQLMALQLGTPGAGAQKPVGDFVDRLGKSFAAGGATDQLLGANGSYTTSVQAAGTTTTDMFSTKGTAVTALGQFVGGATDVFRVGGSFALALSPFGDVVTAGLKPGADAINTFMTDLAQAIQNVGTWFGDASLSSVTWSNILFGGQTGGGPNGNGTLAHANGLGGGMPGHWAMIGERGPEAMYVPAGATIVPNHVLPGHADGLAGSTLPMLALPGLLAGLGVTVQGKAQSDLTALIGRMTSAQHAGSSGGASGISGGGDLIAAIEAATSNPGEQMAMLMGAALETGMRNVAQIGGGPGAGYWQIEAGPGGQYAGQVDPYNAAAAARFMEPAYRAAMGAFDPSNLEFSLADVAYGAEGPAARYGGDRIAAAWSLIQPFLSGGGISPAAGPFQGTGFPNVLADAQGHLGEMFHAGHEWNLWCEQFAELAGEDVGYPHLGWLTALAHANSVQLNSGVGPPGSTMLWGSGYYPDGHAAISVGDWSVIGTSPGGISHYDMADKPDYRGWAPPGLATGGLTVGGNPALFVGGDGPQGENEWHLPEPKLRDVVAGAVAAGGGGGQTFVINGGVTVVAQPGHEADAWDVMEAEAKRRGMPL